ncbi:MAG: CDGSH iron-sulfur domain-containing protein [Verrucomicrobia bacterium]|nr:CDGSH iron-sulfur domain-containing protein [Verrucomicrobiota bacterium]
MSWQSSPYKIDATAGQTFAFCACGKTKNPPFCDGSHKGSGISPKIVKAEKDGPIWACGCAKTKNSPFCDGSHKN